MTPIELRLVRRLIPLALLWLALPDLANAFAANTVLITDPNRAALVRWDPLTNTAQDVVVGGPLVTPLGVAVEAAGTILVADAGAGILRFSDTGAYLGNLVPYAGYCDIAPIPESGGFAAIFCSSDSVYLFDAQGTWLSSTAQGSLFYPHSLVRAADGTLYVSQGLFPGSHSLVLASAPFGQLPGGPDLGDAEGISVDRFGNLLVASGTNLVGVLPSTGTQRGKIPVAQNGEAAKKALPLADGRLAVGITAGSCARTAFVDPVTGAIAPGLATCTPLTSIGGMAYVPGKFVAPAALAEGDIVITDTGAFGGWGAVLRIKPTGASDVLLLGGVAARLGDLEVTAEHEIWVLENDIQGETGSEFGLGSIFRLNPRTGRMKLLAGLLPSYNRFGISAEVLGNRGSVAFTESGVGGDLPFGGYVSTLARWNDTVVDRISTTMQQNIYFPGALATNASGPYGSYLMNIDGGILEYVPVNQPFTSLFQYDITPTTSHLGGVAVNPANSSVFVAAGGSQQAIYKSTAGPSWSLLTNLPTARMLDVEANGQLVAAVKEGLADGGGGVIRVDSSTGAQTIVFQGGSVDPFGIAVAPKPACGDGMDDDFDGLTDFPNDPGCRSLTDLWETDDCSDGIDNDDDGAVDYLPPGWPNTLTPRDRGCASSIMQTESPQCDDGVDNDNDGKADLADPQCANVSSNNKESSGCGLGAELVLLLPVLAQWRRQRAAQRN